MGGGPYRKVPFLQERHDFSPAVEQLRQDLSQYWQVLFVFNGYKPDGHEISHEAGGVGDCKNKLILQVAHEEALAAVQVLHEESHFSQTLFDRILKKYPSAQKFIH